MKGVKKAGLGIILFGLIFMIFGLLGVLLDSEVPNVLAPLTALPGLVFFCFGIWVLKDAKKVAEEKVKRESAPITINTKYKEIMYRYDREMASKYYYLITSWVNPEDHKLYLFRSDDIGYDAEKEIENKGITEFKVTYESGNIKNYKVDTSILSGVKYEETR